MNREQALSAVRERVKNENLVKHMLATEAILRALARKIGEDEVEWGMVGLLHDIDIERVDRDMSRHGKLSAEIAQELGATSNVVHTLMTHNEVHGVARETRLDKALFCIDPLTGLITAAVLVRPDRKISNLEAKSVSKRFKEKSFARGARREDIAACSELGLALDEFIAVGVAAMQDIASDLGF